MNPIAAPAPRDRLRFALALFVLSLVILIPSLAPTVTLWDAGEFLAASKVVGIPHPPGTPLWVILAHTWATLLPFGSWAARVIFLTVEPEKVLACQSVAKRCTRAKASRDASAMIFRVICTTP